MEIYCSYSLIDLYSDQTNTAFDSKPFASSINKTLILFLSEKSKEIFEDKFPVFEALNFNLENSSWSLTIIIISLDFNEYFLIILFKQFSNFLISIFSKVIISFSGPLGEIELTVLIVGHSSC